MHLLGQPASSFPGMDGASPEGQPFSQISPLLRHKMLSRAATIAEGTNSSPSPSHRRGSLFSDTSDTRHSFRSSTDNLTRTGGKHEFASSDEPTHWISSPVLFAVLPAIGGLLYQNGGPILTDVLTLALASWFLHWCIRFPWTWYHAAQQRQYIEPEEVDGTILEENEGGDDSSETVLEESSSNGTQLQARKELRRQELIAFAACFASPLLGAYLLHSLRAQLTVADGLVSDYNLTIFVLVAELRPVARLMKMQEEKMLHLQRIVKSDPQDSLKPADAQEISQRLSELETRLSGPTTTSDVDTMRIGAEVRQTIQPQLDALTRAIRRYEKRNAAQTAQIEARFREVDARLKDTLSLAAAAARTGQRPGIVPMVLTWMIGSVSNVLQTSWDIAMYPLRTALSAATLGKSLFIKDERRPRSRVKGHPSISTPRMQSRSGR